MNLNNLKPAWRQFQLVNAMRPMDEQQILLMLESAEGMAMSKTNRWLMYTFMFMILTLCFQGG